MESLVCLVLNTRRDILGHFTVATGLLDTILCHPREVFRPAIVANAAAVIVMHNHPSGDATPSEADIKVTRDLIRAGHLLKIGCATTSSSARPPITERWREVTGGSGWAIGGGADDDVVAQFNFEKLAGAD